MATIEVKQLVDLLSRVKNQNLEIHFADEDNNLCTIERLSVEYDTKGETTIRLVGTNL